MVLKVVQRSDIFRGFPFRDGIWHTILWSLRRKANRGCLALPEAGQLYTDKTCADVIRIALKIDYTIEPLFPTKGRKKML